jgi:MFS family permease
MPAPAPDRSAAVPEPGPAAERGSGSSRDTLPPASAPGRAAPSDAGQATSDPTARGGAPSAPGAAAAEAAEQAAAPHPPAAAQRGTWLVRRLPALGSATYRRFLAGAFVGTIGSWMQSTAQGWLVLDLTNSAAALGIVSAVQTFPVLVFSVFAGVLADRVDRRRLLVATQLFAAGSALTLALLTTAGLVAYWQIMVLAFLAGTATAIQTPAYQAIVSTLVDRTAIGSAVALNSAQFNLARIIGPAVAGAAIAVGGIQLAFWGNALALVVVAVMLATLRIASQPTLVRIEASMWANLLDGLRYVRTAPMILTLVALSGVPALFMLNYLVFLPIYARDLLGIGAAGLGLLAGGIGSGALIGALGLAALRPSGGSGRSLLLGLAIGSIALVVFALSGIVVVSVVALAVLGACQVLYYATTNTLLQVLVPGRLRGRVISLYILASWGLIPVGNVVAGLLAEWWGPPLALAGGGLVTLGVTAAVAVARPAGRRLGGTAADPADGPDPA